VIRVGRGRWFIVKQTRPRHLTTKVVEVPNGEEPPLKALVGDASL
jgi:hypothetical protein